jgi:Na+/proline symporter
MLCIVPISIGFAGRIVLPQLKDTDQLLPMLASQVLHPAVFTLFLSALVSAIMSSADSSLLAGSSLLTNNVIRPIFPKMTDIQQLHATRSVTIILTVIATVLGLYVKNVYDMMVNSWVSLLVVVFIPVTAALYSKRADAKCIWATMLVATFVCLIYILCGVINTRDFSDDMLNRAAMYGFTAGLFTFFTCIFTLKTNPVHLHIPQSEEEC